MDIVTAILLLVVALGIKRIFATRNPEVRSYVNPPETNVPPEEDTAFDASKFQSTRDTVQGNFVVPTGNPMRT